MAENKRKDPYMGFKFRIAIDGITEGGFSEVSGIQATTQVEEFREGGQNMFVHKIPKETKFENLTLKKGLADADTLYKWHRDVISGKFDRKKIDIFMLKDHSDEIAHTWSYQDAFPVKWSGPELKSDSNAIAFETIEIGHHGYI